MCAFLIAQAVPELAGLVRRVGRVALGEAWSPDVGNAKSTCAQEVASGWRVEEGARNGQEQRDQIVAITRV
jgi:hypothetical protein